MDSYLVWEPPGGTLSILVSRSVLERLKQFAGEAFTNPRPDAGAVLLGHGENLAGSGRRVVTVEDFQSGVSRLHDASVVGFARFRRHRALHLDPADFLMLKSSPDMICLMARPGDDGTAVGGFFYRDGNTVRCPGAVMQFPISPDAVDCRGLLFVPEADGVTRESGETSARATPKRLAYAGIGLVLMLSPAVIWISSRHGRPEAPTQPESAPAVVAAPVAGPVSAPVSAPISAAVPEPSASASAPLSPEAKRLARHGRLRHGRKLPKHVR